MVFLALVEAVDDAIGRTRRTWKPSCNMSVYRQEMDALSKFTKISIFPHLRHLDFYKIPKTIRYRIVENLATFEYLTALVLGGSGSGQV